MAAHSKSFMILASTVLIGQWSVMDEWTHRR